MPTPISIPSYPKPPKAIPFLAWRWPATGLSLILIAVGVIGLITQGLNFSVEFTGGNVLEFHFSKAVSIEAFHNGLNNIGIKGAMVAFLGSDKEVIIRTQVLTDDEIEKITTAVAKLDPSNPGELRRSDSVGSQVASDLGDQAVYAVLISLVLLLAYISYRFQFKFAVGAVVALAHDVTIVVGVFALMGWEFSLSVFAAVLTIIGYSLNDTIIIFDRIRENLKRLRNLDTKQIINISLTQTLERTLITFFTTLIVILALFFAGGEVFRGFSLALIIGLVVGTYSSVYIASNIILMMKVSRNDLLTPIDKEENLPQDAP